MEDNLTGGKKTYHTPRIITNPSEINPMDAMNQLFLNTTTGSSIQKTQRKEDLEHLIKKSKEVKPIASASITLSPQLNEVLSFNTDMTPTVDDGSDDAISLDLSFEEQPEQKRSKKSIFSSKPKKLPVKKLIGIPLFTKKSTTPNRKGSPIPSIINDTEENTRRTNIRSAAALDHNLNTSNKRIPGKPILSGQYRPVTNKYTISADIRAHYLKELLLPPTTFKSIMSVWRKDKWENLIDPPDWVTDHMYSLCITEEMTNSEKIIAFYQSSMNLKIARATCRGDSRQDQIIKLNQFLNDSNKLISPEFHMQYIVDKLTEVSYLFCECLNTLPIFQRDLQEKISVQVNRVAAECNTFSSCTRAKIDQIEQLFQTYAQLSDNQSGSILASNYRLPALINNSSVSNTHQPVEPRIPEPKQPPLTLCPDGVWRQAM